MAKKASKKSSKTKKSTVKKVRDVSVAQTDAKKSDVQIKKQEQIKIKEEAKKEAQKTFRPSLRDRFRSLFSKKSKLQKDLKKIEKLTEKQERQEKIKKKIFAQTFTKEKVPRKRWALQELLTKSGVTVPSQEFKKRTFMATVILSLTVSLLVLILGSVNQRSWIDIAIFLAGFWTAGFALMLILVAICVAAFLDIRIHQRRQQLELVLPDYLQLVAANIGAGMTVDKALWYAVRPRFGILAKEIEDVAKRVVTGEELSDALSRFAKQYDSPILQRSVALLLEGIAAGGKIADLLQKISNDISEQRILRQEMAANVTTYVIFISFAAILAAPVLFGLSTQLLVVIQSIASGIPAGSSSTGFSVSADVINLTDFRIFSVVLLVATAIMSSLIVGVIRAGDTFEGLRYTPIFIFVSVLLYFLSVSFFGGIFGGLV